MLQTDDFKCGKDSVDLTRLAIFKYSSHSDLTFHAHVCGKKKKRARTFDDENTMHLNTCDTRNTSPCWKFEIRRNRRF